MNAPTSYPEPAYRDPPHNFEAEQALLGALLVNNRCAERVAEFLRLEHFADALHGRIYQAALILIDRGQVATPVTLKTYLAQDPGLADMGGDEYLMRLAGAAASIINAEDYGRLIFDLALRREMIGVGEDMVNDAFEVDHAIDAVSILERYEATLFALSENRIADATIASMAEAVGASLANAEEVYKADGKLRGLTTGLADLDRKLGGLRSTDLLILAGRPSMGKSALALNIAENAAADLERRREKKKVVFFSLEMSRDQLADRSLSRSSRISSHKIHNGPLSAADMQALSAAAIELRTMPLLIDDTPALTVASIRARCRRIAKKDGLALVIIDYLQLIGSAVHGDRSRRGAENRTQEVSEITRSLKALAKELGVPVIALSQLSRQVESRDDKRPQLSDLRESGSIEQDADVVIFVYREQYYLERSEPKEGTAKHDQWNADLGACVNTAEAIVAKQRHGPVGTVRLYFDGNITTFGNLGQP